jgi:hypothetical protein
MVNPAITSDAVTTANSFLISTSVKSALPTNEMFRILFHSEKACDPRADSSPSIRGSGNASGRLNLRNDNFPAGESLGSAAAWPHFGRNQSGI